MSVLSRFFQAGSFSSVNIPAASGRNDHYLGLDFLRGVAALAVVLYHSSTRFNLPFLFPHGYLAVDFFFSLSGFVIARAYQTRISSGRLAVPEFVLIRAIRLIPLIVLGTLVAAIGEFARPGITNQHQHLIDAVSAFLLNIILMPMLYPNSLTFTVFPLNGPSWSLFLEAVANGVFAVWAWSRLRLHTLVPLLIVSFLGMIWGVHLTGKIDFGAVRDDFWLGFPRVGWSFFSGIILFHFRNHSPNVLFIIPTCVLIFVLLTPDLGHINSTFDTVCVLFVLPWIVWAASLARFRSTGRRWSAWSGDLSYPIYTLHYPLLRYLGGGGTVLQLPLFGRLGVVFCATLMILVASAVAYVLFDAPIRKWLTQKLVLPRLLRKHHGLKFLE
ncbi:acyltransferase [Methylobacterium sp. J-072]|uniref:acyltransferase family protein n=1 Tax=Methylobacterium sp. J-072 TaxID=2836651 RepID=UPI001FBA27ED|nr:acyltransferase [Methylobacterium sp. J-072]MCJ2091115.1 acyltransferase [Methylobacterium sp. J-072]